MQPVRLGILGAGLAVKQLHWPALQQLDQHFVVRAICDRDPANAGEVAELVGGDPTISADWAALLNDANVEAVLISLPIHLNADAIRAAASAGKHVICEKPLAASLPQAEALAAELRHAPQVILIAENFHYREDLREARRWIDAGLIGTVAVISARAAFWSDTDEGFASTPWRHDHQYRGAVIADAGVHQAAALRVIGGEIEQVHAFVKDLHPVLAGPDTLALNLRFASGALGQLLFAGAVRPAEPTFDAISVLGTEGSISIGQGVARLDRSNGETKTCAPEDRGGYVGEFRNFYGAIRHGEPVIATLEQTLADWRIIMRALDSAESRAVVLI